IEILYRKNDFFLKQENIIVNKNFKQTIVACFIKIIYLVAINYNDLIVLAMIQGKGSNLKFIHYHNEIGELILKMLFKLCITFTTNFEYKIIKKRTMTIFNQTLQLFIIGNNN